MKRKNTLNEAKRYRTVGIALAFIILLIAFVGMFADHWQREMRGVKINIQGMMITQAHEIRKLAAIPDSLSLANIDLHQVESRIAMHPFIKKVDLQRNPPDELQINIVERTPIAIIITENEKEYYVDEDGFVLPKIFSPFIYDLPVLTGVSAGIALFPGKKITHPRIQQAIEVIQTAKNIDQNLYHLFSEINVSKQQDLILYTIENGIPVIFGPAIGAAKKLLYFDTFWKKVVDSTGSTCLEYIDLRYAGRVVVKWSDEIVQSTTAVRDSVIEEL